MENLECNKVLFEFVDAGGVCLYLYWCCEERRGLRRRSSGVLLRRNTNSRRAATVVRCLFVLWFRCFRCKCYRSSCSRLSAGNLIFVIIAVLFVFVWSLCFPHKVEIVLSLSLSPPCIYLCYLLSLWCFTVWGVGERSNQLMHSA